MSQDQNTHELIYKRLGNLDMGEVEHNLIPSQNYLLDGLPDRLGSVAGADKVTTLGVCLDRNLRAHDQ